MPNALAQIKAGRLRALAVTTASRFVDLPDVPTLDEAGLTGFNVSGWLGLLAPARTPPEVVARLQAEATKALRSPDAVRALATAGVNVKLSSGPEFDKLLHAESERWGKVITQAGMKVD